MDDRKQEPGADALQEPDGHQGGHAELDDGGRADQGQHGRGHRTPDQQRFLLETVGYQSRGYVGYQVANEKRAEQRRPGGKRPVEHGYVLFHLSLIVCRVGFRVHGHYGQGQVDPLHKTAHYTQEQQQAL